METTDHKNLAVARVYSAALHKAASAQGQDEALLAELGALASHARSEPNFAHFLASPLISSEQRRRSLETMFRGRASDLLVDALQVLNRRDRLGLLPSIVEAYRASLFDLSGRLTVRVTTAVPLTDTLRQALSAKIKALTGLEPVLEESVDASILGGMVLQVGNQKIDASVRQRLARLSQTLLERASREVRSGSHVAA